MSRQFLVDGYNVMKQIPDLSCRRLEDGRAGLIRFIRERRPHGSGRNGITVVFDGQENVGGFGATADDISADVNIIFTRGTSADDHIRESVEQSSDPGQIICVTDDRELALACRHRGARIWSVEEFVSKGYKEEAAAQRRSRDMRRREGDGKVISGTAARKIDQEFLALWIRQKP
jgi:predicted RNA-binding protein with PIN domain